MPDLDFTAATRGTFSLFGAFPSAAASFAAVIISASASSSARLVSANSSPTFPAAPRGFARVDVSEGTTGANDAVPSSSVRGVMSSSEMSCTSSTTPSG